MPKYRTPLPGQLELPLAGWDAIRQATYRRRDELVSTAKLSPTLRRMLRALHARCCGKRFCWPSLRTLAADLGYQWPTANPARKAGDPPQPNPAKRTMLRQLRRLEKLGLLHVEHHYRPDGGQSSSFYAVRYGALRAAGCERPPASPVTPPGVMYDAPRRHQRRPPASLVTPHELNGRELNVRENKDTAAAAVLVAPPGRRDGGGGGLAVVSKPVDVRGSAGASPASPSRVMGSWTGAIDKETLATSEVQRRIFGDAIRAGLLRDSPINRVRIVALCLQARTKAGPGGFVVTTIQRGTWHLLSRENVKQSVGRLKIALTAEQLDQVRMMEAPR